jgi:ribosome-binding protein aMBF1 (putative translation factor)
MLLSQLYIQGETILERERSRYQRGLAPGEKPGVEKHATSPIAKATKSKGISQEKVADKAGLDPSTISRYKRSYKKGQKKPKGRRPSFASLKKVTKALGTQASTLFPELSV